METTRVLVADDSALMRTVIRKMLDGVHDLEIVGAARDGEDAILKARELRPDVVTMDINMPKLDGISALQTLVAEQICPVIMMSSLTRAGAVTTLECLELGAFDFIEKPGGTVTSNMDSVAEELIEKLRAAKTAGLRPPSRRLRRRPILGRSAHATGLLNGFDRAVAIGISTGGPTTLLDVLPMLPGDFGAPLFLVQHMPAKFIGTFAQRLGRECALKVVEAEAGMEVNAGTCYIAPGGVHMEVHRRLSGKVVIRTTTTPKSLFMPSVSVMMQSVLKAFGRKTIGVLMTGIGSDGADEMVAIRKAGGFTVAESSETAVVYGMPREAFERGGADVVVPSWQVAEELIKALESKDS